MSLAIEAKGLSKNYFAKGLLVKQVFADLNFSLDVGERLAITGANGCGKTTLLKILVNLILPTAGSIELIGSRNPSWVPASDQSFYSRLTGRENLLFFLSLQKISKSEITRRIDFWSEHLALKESLKTPYYLCSSGMKQSLALARGLVNDPAVLILDEPTRSLDPKASLELIDSLKNLPGTKTIVFSTHSLEEAKALGTRSLNLDLEAGVDATSSL